MSSGETNLQLVQKSASAQTSYRHWLWFIPSSRPVTSAETAAEQVEHYWGALLRDVHFTDYTTSSLASQAAADMNGLSFVQGGHNHEFPYPVTPQNLFRGQFYPGDGNVQGPYLSQFLLQPTFFGSQALTQQYQRFLSLSEGGAEYMTSVSEYQNIQNGVPPSSSSCGFPLSSSSTASWASFCWSRACFCWHPASRRACGEDAEQTLAARGLTV